MLVALAAGFALVASQLWYQQDVSRMNALRMLSSVGDVVCRSGEGSWRPCTRVPGLCLPRSPATSMPL
jgi:hypothetical protein